MTTKTVELTDEQVLEQLAREKAERERIIREARENLAKYGTTLPPVGVASSVPAVVTPTPNPPPAPGTRRKRKEIDPKWFNVMKTCPHCGVEKNVGRDFGVIEPHKNGVEYPAAWCKQCRSESSEKYRKPKDAKKPAKKAKKS